MRMCRVPAAVIIAVVGVAGLTACGGTTKSPAAASAPASSSLASPSVSASSATPTISATPARSASAKPTASAPSSVRPTTSVSAVSTAHATSSAPAASSGSASFTVPAIPGDNVVSAYGSYAKSGARVKVTVCAKQTGKAFSVGAIALAYNTSGASKNIGAVVLTGPGNTECGTITFLFYTAHLTVHAFIGSGGTISKTGPVLSLY
jgi:hypothetical protein